MDLVFPFAEYWWFYAGFTLAVLALLAVDLGVFHRQAHEVSFRESLGWSVVWVALALAFNYGFFLYAVDKAGPEVGAWLGLEFLTGYLVEKSLAVDNVFVFVLVFSYFGIPARYQHRVLFYGILGALAFRALFIALGSVLMQYDWVVLVFGALLLFTGVNMLWAPERQISPDRNPVIRLFRRLMPITPTLHGERFVVAIDGRRHATPLLVALVFLELSDVIFAIDSVPAIFALTNEPLIVFTSNIFAIVGLRSLFFVLEHMVKAFQFLKYGLGVILVFVGLKMVWLNQAFGGKFPITLSLAIIGSILALSILVSIGYEKTRAAPRPKT
jgi:tellurite resistance protein TerC